MTNKLALVKKKLKTHTKKLSLNQQPPVHLQNCWYKYAYDRVKLWYTIQHRTVLNNLPSYPPHNHHSSDTVYWTEGEHGTDRRTYVVQCIMRPPMGGRAACSSDRLRSINRPPAGDCSGHIYHGCSAETQGLQRALAGSATMTYCCIMANVSVDDDKLQLLITLRTLLQNTFNGIIRPIT